MPLPSSDDALHEKGGVESVTRAASAGATSEKGAGVVVSTTHDDTGGLGSTLPDASVARTLNKCRASLRDGYDFGDVHADQAPWSSRHSNVAPAGSFVENVNCEVCFVALGGPLSIVVVGATRS